LIHITPYLLISCFAVLLFSCTPAAAQRVEISPFGGYRIGWSVSEIGGAPVTEDAGGVSFGVVADIPIGPPQDGYKFELLLSRESASVKVRRSIFDPPVRAHVTVDQIMIGAMQELEEVPARPFVSALLGLTRYAAPDGYDVRFALGLGGGGKFFATPHLGLRIDGRVFMTIVSLDGAAACAGGCVATFAANPVFQGELTAGLIVAF
jgi:hypothetical protein